mmetsp:Transcript_86859/g.260902  ORF Transcript_86859/g.260902 Transcript_86859/m.260902 type:complete len:235 (+) Transcript_86859:873-1577(+)
MQHVRIRALPPLRTGQFRERSLPLFRVLCACNAVGAHPHLRHATVLCWLCAKDLSGRFSALSTGVEDRQECSSSQGSAIQTPRRSYAHARHRSLEASNCCGGHQIPDIRTGETSTHWVAGGGASSRHGLPDHAAHRQDFSANGVLRQGGSRDRSGALEPHALRQPAYHGGRTQVAHEGALEVAVNTGKITVVRKEGIGTEIRQFLRLRDSGCVATTTAFKCDAAKAVVADSERR